MLLDKRRFPAPEGPPQHLVDMNLLALFLSEEAFVALKSLTKFVSGYAVSNEGGKAVRRGRVAHRVDDLVLL